MADKKTLDIFLKLLKKQNIKLKDVKPFLKNHALDLNEYDKSGYNSLHYAIKSEKPEIVKVLLNMENEEFLSIKADPNKETKDKANQIFTSPILLSLLYTNDQVASNQMIRYLYNSGANINYKDEEGTTLFLHSCEKGRTDIIKFLINKIERSENENEAETENPQNENNKMTLKELINQKSNNGGGLHFAIIGQQDEVIELLLENNIDLNIVNAQGDTALEYALKEKQMNMFKTMLDYIVANREMSNEDKKKILNHQNNDGNTILHELAFCKSSVVTNIVLKLPQEFGVDATLKNKEGYDYKEVSENIIELEKQKAEQEKRLKEERRKLKEELRQKKYEEEKKIIDERKRYEEKLRRQEEFGAKLIENRGKIFTVVFIIFLGLMYLIIKNASVKKERII